MAAMERDGTAEQPVRLALIIGVDNYSRIKPDLNNAVRDAENISGKLGELGFDTKLLPNPTIESCLDVVEVIRNKSRSIIETGRQVVLLVFFAGHGCQSSKLSYLLCHDSNGTNDKSLVRTTIGLDDLVKELSGSSTTSIFIIDACRNDISSAGSSATRSFTGPNRGLASASMANLQDTYVAYSTAPGELASDGEDGGNSPFTESFVRHLGAASDDIHKVMSNVTKDLMRSQNPQRPYVTHSFTDDFYFHQRTARPEPIHLEKVRGERKAEVGSERRGQPQYAEIEAFDEVYERDNLDTIAAFLHDFPDSQHIAKLEFRRRELIWRLLLFTVIASGLTASLLTQFLTSSDIWRQSMPSPEKLATMIAEYRIDEQIFYPGVFVALFGAALGYLVSFYIGLRTGTSIFAASVFVALCAIVGAAFGLLIIGHSNSAAMVTATASLVGLSVDNSNQLALTYTVASVVASTTLLAPVLIGARSKQWAVIGLAVPIIVCSLFAYVWVVFADHHNPKETNYFAWLVMPWQVVFALLVATVMSWQAGSERRRQDGVTQPQGAPGKPGATQ